MEKGVIDLGVATYMLIVTVILTPSAPLWFTLMMVLSVIIWFTVASLTFRGY